MKTKNSLINGLAGLLLGSLATFGLAGKANAMPLISAETKISAQGQDYDLDRLGLQTRYSWEIENIYSSGDFIDDSLKKFQINGNLSDFYGFQMPANWQITNSGTNSTIFENTSNDFLNNIYWGQKGIFSALIDESKAGYNPVSSLAYANSGLSNSTQVIVPEPSCMLLLGLGACAFLRKKR